MRDEILEVAREIRGVVPDGCGHLFPTWYPKLLDWASRLESTAGTWGCERCEQLDVAGDLREVAAGIKRDAGMPREVWVVIWDKPGWHDVEVYTTEQEAYDRANKGEKTGHVQIRRVPVHGAPEQTEMSGVEIGVIYLCRECALKMGYPIHG
ncbi:MAG: hypothetical protein GWN58_17615 [Anaerolineae bacterium]|nr:hypothetical protein [Anaerolineae bacterium]